MINKLLALVILFSCSLVSAQTYTRVGETTLGTDGSIINKVGNSTFINHSDGTSSTISELGNTVMIISSDGTSSTINKVGNSTFINHSDGSSETINKIGNSTLTDSWIPYSINTRKR